MQSFPLSYSYWLCLGKCTQLLNLINTSVYTRLFLKSSGVAFGKLHMADNVEVDAILHELFWLNHFPSRNSIWFCLDYHACVSPAVCNFPKPKLVGQKQSNVNICTTFKHV